MGLNSLAAAGLTFAGVMAMVRLPVLPLDPRLWAGQYFEGATVTGMGYLYSVLLWALAGALIALCMLALRPRAVYLYGLACALAFILTSQSWHIILNGSFMAGIRELVFILTVPLLYGVFVRKADSGSRMRDGRGPSKA